MLPTNLLKPTSKPWLWTRGRGIPRIDIWVQSPQFLIWPLTGQSDYFFSSSPPSFTTDLCPHSSPWQKIAPLSTRFPKHTNQSWLLPLSITPVRLISKIWQFYLASKYLLNPCIRFHNRSDKPVLNIRLAFIELLMYLRQNLTSLFVLAVLILILILCVVGTINILILEKRKWGVQRWGDILKVTQ